MAYKSTRTKTGNTTRTVTKNSNGGVRYTTSKCYHEPKKSGLTISNSWSGGNKRTTTTYKNGGGWITRKNTTQNLVKDSKPAKRYKNVGDENYDCDDDSENDENFLYTLAMFPIRVLGFLFKVICIILFFVFVVQIVILVL
jgi:hypothetical protein